MNILYYCVDDPHQKIQQGLTTALAEHNLQAWPDVANPADIELAIVWGAPDEFFEGLVNLRAVFSLAAGVEHLLNHPSLPANVPIAKLEDAGMGEKMAEYVLYGVLQAQRHMSYYREGQQHDSGAQYAPPVDA